MYNSGNSWLNIDPTFRIVQDLKCEKIAALTKIVEEKKNLKIVDINETTTA